MDLWITLKKKKEKKSNEKSSQTEGSITTWMDLFGFFSSWIPGGIYEQLVHLITETMEMIRESVHLLHFFETKPEFQVSESTR